MSFLKKKIKFILNVHTSIHKTSVLIDKKNHKLKKGMYKTFYFIKFGKIFIKLNEIV